MKNMEIHTFYNLQFWHSAMLARYDHAIQLNDAAEALQIHSMGQEHRAVDNAQHTSCKSGVLINQAGKFFDCNVWLLEQLQ